MDEQLQNSERVGYERHGGDWYYQNEQCNVLCKILLLCFNT